MTSLARIEANRRNALLSTGPRTEAGKAIAASQNIPFIAVNHLEGHALTPRLTDDVEFPYLLLLVSGGHTQLLIAEGVGRYKRNGTTLDVTDQARGLQTGEALQLSRRFDA